MGIVFKNNAKTTLASSLSNSATSATVTDGSVFPSLSAGEFFLLTFDDGTNNEICKCTARSGNTLTIVRAQESTTARAFSSGDAAEGRVTAGVLETIQENIAAKSANQTVYNTTTASSATDYDIGIDPSVEANAMVFLNGVMQHHDTFSFSGSTLTFDAAPPNGMALEVIVDNLINLQSSNLTVDTFTATSGQTDFVLSDTPAAETNLIVFVDGVFQDQDSYTISNNTLTITDGVVLNRGVTVYVINPVNIGTPSDGTVTSAKLSGNITMPGTLTVGSNDVAFDSPTFVVDNANSRVGLGTASPSVPVDIVGDVKMSANLTVDTSTLVVDSANNRVGIGTTSPESILHIEGSGVDSLRFGNIGASFNTALRISRDDTSIISGNPLGYLEFGGKDNTGTVDTAHAYIAGIASGTHSAGSNPTDLTFGTTPSGSSTINEVMRITSAGSIGIGTDSPNTPAGNKSLHIAGTTGAELILERDDSGVAADDFIGGLAFLNSDGSNTPPHYLGITARATNEFGASQLEFFSSFEQYPSGTPDMILDSSGNVGIGRTDPTQLLEVHKSTGGDQTVAKFSAHNYGDTGKTFIEIGTEYGDGSSRIGSFNDTGNSSVLVFDTHSATSGQFTERMRIDSSGNLLVGVTSTTIPGVSNTTAGTSFRGDDGSFFSRSLSSGDANYVMHINRSTADGNILGFAKDGNVVGGIASKDGDMALGTGDTGLRFIDGSDAITPHNTSTNAGRDNAIDLGTSGSRFKDLYLSGQALVQSGGTTAPSFAFVNDTDTGISRPTTDAINIVNGGTEKWRFTSGGDLQMKSTNSAAIFAANGGETQGYARTSGSGFIGIFGENNYQSCGAHVEIATNSNFGWSPLYINRYLANSGEDDRLIQFNINGGEDSGSIEYNFSNNNFELLNASDYRLKSNIVDYTGGLATINNIQVRKFTKNNVDNIVGFIAHELQEHIPSAVKGEKDAVGTIVETGEEGAIYQKVSKEHLVPYLVSAIQEQQAQIETLKQEIREIREGG